MPAADPHHGCQKAQPEDVEAKQRIVYRLQHVVYVGPMSNRCRADKQCEHWLMHTYRKEVVKESEKPPRDINCDTRLKQCGSAVCGRGPCQRRAGHTTAPVTTIGNSTALHTQADCFSFTQQHCQTRTRLDTTCATASCICSAPSAEESAREPARQHACKRLQGKRHADEQPSQCRKDDEQQPRVAHLLGCGVTTGL
jgi:hypothetical protein